MSNYTIKGKEKENKRKESWYILLLLLGFESCIWKSFSEKNSKKVSICICKYFLKA